MIKIKRDILLSEVSAWLLHYVHIAWCDGPLCNIAQNNRTRRETVIGPRTKLHCRLKHSDRLHPCNGDNMITEHVIVVQKVLTNKHLKVNTRTEHTLIKTYKAHTGTVSLFDIFLGYKLGSFFFLFVLFLKCYHNTDYFFHKSPRVAHDKRNRRQTFMQTPFPRPL